MLRRIRAIVVSILMVAAVVYLATPPSESARDHSTDKLGFLMHRGKKYWLKDLMDPAYRAASDDRFVKLFESHEEFAGMGSNEVNVFQNTRGREHYQRARLTPWAGSDIADVVP